MSNKRTPEEILRQIDGIRAEKATLPEHSMFGDPNWESMDAMIDVVQGFKTAEDFDPITLGMEQEDDEDAHAEQSYIFNEAQRAENWLDGTENEDLFSEVDENEKDKC